MAKPGGFNKEKARTYPHAKTLAADVAAAVDDDDDDDDGKVSTQAKADSTMHTMTDKKKLESRMVRDAKSNLMLELW